MPRCGQMARNAKTRPSRPRPMRIGSPSSVLCTSRPGRTSWPTSATYHKPRRSWALRSCMVLSPGAARSLCPHERQIGIAGLAASLRQHAMHLAAMMGLMIEHMRDRKPSRFRHVRLDRARVISEFAGEPCRVEPIRPVDHDCVEGFALPLQVFPIAIKRYRFRNAARGDGRAGEAAHPNAISPEQVAECCMDRAEKCPAVASPFGVGDCVGDAIEIVV